MMQDDSMQVGPIAASSTVPDGVRGCGQRLCKAREAASLSQAEVAARLKMPLRVVKSLEEEDWSRLGAPVFVRGQLRSYSRLLGLTTAPMMEAAGVAVVEPPLLRPRTYTSSSRRFAELLARRLVYIVLTAAIAVPIWLATRTHLGEITHQAAPLDAPGLGAASQARPERAGQARDPGTVVASIASLPARRAVEQGPASTGGLTLQLNDDSWVEVIGKDGKRLEETLLHAGDRRSYANGEVGRVVIGNAAAVDVRRDGRPLNLEPYQRANVARFTVSSDGSLAPAVD